MTTETSDGHDGNIGYRRLIGLGEARTVKLVTNEEVIAIAMLVGDGAPALCAYCNGKRNEKTITGVRICRECGGTGFEYIGRKTLATITEMLRNGG